MIKSKISQELILSKKLKLPLNSDTNRKIKKDFGDEITLNKKSRKQKPKKIKGPSLSHSLVFNALIRPENNPCAPPLGIYKPKYNQISKYFFRVLNIKNKKRYNIKVFEYTKI